MFVGHAVRVLASIGLGGDIGALALQFHGVMRGLPLFACQS